MPHTSNEPNGTPNVPKHPLEAAVDLTTGFGVDSFLLSGEVADPWQNRCTRDLVDIVVNHRKVCYPLPTSEGGEEKSLPKAVRSLLSAELLYPNTGETAGSISASLEDLEREFPAFAEFICNEKQKVCGWLDFHYKPEIKEQHLNGIPADVQPWTLDFWKMNKEGRIAKLQKTTGINDMQLCYAFDVFFRGLLYYVILDSDKIPYFPHPYRHALLRDCHGSGTLLSEVHGYSWGSAMLRLMRTDSTMRDSGWLADQLCRLHSAVNDKNIGATPYQLEPLSKEDRHDKLMQVALEAKIPSKLNKILKDDLEKSALALSFGTGLIGRHSLAIALHAGALAMGFWKGTVPRIALNFRFCRAITHVEDLEVDEQDEE